jgi:predicted nucleic-acid-binding protein
MLALETNILARYDVRALGPTRAQEEVASATVERGAQLFVAKTVVLELEWVLRGVYGHPPEDVCRVFERLLALPHGDIEDRAAVEAALANLHKGLDFADALHHASSRACESPLSFDARGFAGKARRLAMTPPVRGPSWSALHSMTSSARSSSACGITKPSVLAVLRLMTSSNFVGCSTGSSCGRAPASTRPA